MNEEPPNSNPWMRSLLVWGGIFLALFFAVSLFSARTDTTTGQIQYSDFRAKVAEGSVADAQVGEAKITGHMKDGDAFTTIPIPNDTSLAQLLQANGVRYAGKAAEEPNVLMYIVLQALPFLLILGVAFFALKQVQKGGGSGAMGFGKSKAKLLTERQAASPLPMSPASMKRARNWRKSSSFCAIRVAFPSSAVRSPRVRCWSAVRVPARPCWPARSRAKPACRSLPSRARTLSKCSSASAPAACAICSNRPRRTHRASSSSTKSTRWGVIAVMAWAIPTMSASRR